MLQFFREGLEYKVQDERLIKTRIARVSGNGEFLTVLLSRAEVSAETKKKTVFVLCIPRLSIVLMTHEVNETSVCFVWCLELM